MNLTLSGSSVLQCNISSAHSPFLLHSNAPKHGCLIMYFMVLVVRHIGYCYTLFLQAKHQWDFTQVVGNMLKFYAEQVHNVICVVISTWRICHNYCFILSDAVNEQALYPELFSDHACCYFQVLALTTPMHRSISTQNILKESFELQIRKHSSPEVPRNAALVCWGFYVCTQAESSGIIAYHLLHLKHTYMTSCKVYKMSYKSYKKMCKNYKTSYKNNYG